MSIDTITCVYHNTDEAIEATHKCERCKNTVCLLHIEKVRIHRYNQADEIYEFCVDCAQKSRQLNDQLQSNPTELMKMLGTANSLQKYFFVFFSLFFLSVVGIMFFIFSNFSDI